VSNYVTTDEDLRYDVSDRIAETPADERVEPCAARAAHKRRCGGPRPTRTSAPFVLTSALPRRFSARLDLGMMLGKSATEVRRLLDKL
jgi:hypothetical protein